MNEREIESVELVAQGPFGKVPKAAPARRSERGRARAEGLRFERKVAKRLGVFARELGFSAVYAEQWIRFRESGRVHYAQPDLFILTDTHVVLFECKLSQTDMAEGQCMELYAPLLRQLFNRPVVPCQVFKNIRAKTVHDIAHPAILFFHPVTPNFPITCRNWHYQGDIIC